jgi:ribosomal-protein-alanine N-acetyltransferase
MYLFETPRLIVKKYSEDDGEAFFALNGDPDVMRYIRKPKTRTESDAFLCEVIAFYANNPNLGRFAVIEKKSQQFIASFALIPIDSEPEKLQAGYALLPAAWGKGFASELLQYGIPFFFQHHGDDMLYGITEQENIASQKVLLKAGFTLEKSYTEDHKQLFRFFFERNRLNN